MTATAMSLTPRRHLRSLTWIALFLITCVSLSFAAGYWGSPPTPAAAPATPNAPAGQPSWSQAATTFATAYTTPGNSPSAWTRQLQPVTTADLYAQLSHSITTTGQPPTLTLQHITALTEHPDTVTWAAHYTASTTILTGTSRRQPDNTWLITTAHLKRTSGTTS